MAIPAALLLALDAAAGWSAWLLACVIALSSAFWFSRRGEDGEPADESPATGPGSRAEDAIRIRELQETVDELTRLRAAALEAAQRRDEFLTTISHELRSPLNAILGWTQVLEPRRDLPSDVRDALHDWLEVYGEIVNIFNRQNFHPDAFQGPGGSPGKYEVANGLPRLPSYGVRVKF